MFAFSAFAPSNNYFSFLEVRPPATKGSPVLIEFSVFVVDINSINVEDMDFR